MIVRKGSGALIEIVARHGVQNRDMDDAIWAACFGPGRGCRRLDAIQRRHFRVVAQTTTVRSAGRRIASGTATHAILLGGAEPVGRGGNQNEALSFQSPPSSVAV